MATKRHPFKVSKIGQTGTGEILLRAPSATRKVSPLKIIGANRDAGTLVIRFYWGSGNQDDATKVFLSMSLNDFANFSGTPGSEFSNEKGALGEDLYCKVSVGTPGANGYDITVWGYEEWKD